MTGLKDEALQCSALIAALQAAMQKHGDLYVVYQGSCDMTAIRCVDVLVDDDNLGEQDKPNVLVLQDGAWLSDMYPEHWGWAE